MDKNKIIVFCIAVFVILLAAFPATGDTFTHKATGEKFYGYAVLKKHENLNIIRTKKGFKRVNLSEYKIERNTKGRKKNVITVPLDESIMYETETNAFKEAIRRGADAGPLFVLIEIDSPGGRLDLCLKICETILDTNTCDIHAFIKGGKYGGAYSAAAAVALACDKIYMAENTAIGAATPYMMTQHGVKEADYEILKGFSEHFGYLAQQHNRPALPAMAMVDRDLAVIEIKHMGEIFFIEPKDNQPPQPVVHTWSEKGSLLTLPAHDAVRAGIADKTVFTRDDILIDLKAESARLMQDKSPIRARLELEKAKKRIENAIAKADLRTKKINSGKMSYNAAISSLTHIIIDLRKCVSLTETYPDLAEYGPPLRQWLRSAENARR